MRERRKVQVISPASGFAGIVAKKTGRNELCACGSGLKSKKCCGSKTEYYNREKTTIEAVEEAKQKEADE